MLESIIVYSLTCFSMIGVASISYKDNYLSKRINPIFFDIAIIVIFTFVFGTRLDVGIDYKQYLYYYEFTGFDRMEYLFRIISSYLSNHFFPSYIFFSLWVFLQISLLLLSFKSERKILPYLIFILFTGQYFLFWMNVIRQDVAACILIFSISYVSEHKLWKFLICCLLAFGFHKSAILLIFIYPIFYYKKDFFSNRLVQYILWILALYISIRINVFQTLESHIETLLSVFFKDDMYSMIGIENTISEVKLGGSFITFNLIDLFIIYYSKVLKNNFNSRFKIFYSLYFIGILIHLIFSSSYILLRPFRYLKFFKMIVSAYLLHYLSVNRNLQNNIVFVVIVTLYLLQYSALFFYDEDQCLLYNSIFNQ